MAWKLTVTKAINIANIPEEETVGVSETFLKFDLHSVILMKSINIIGTQSLILI